MRNRSNHLGSSFEIWNSNQGWFWLVVNSDRSGGAIGSAATEAEAIREARISVERLSARDKVRPSCVDLDAANVYAHPIRRSRSIALPLIGW
jgi:hypothetical protein